MKPSRIFLLLLFFMANCIAMAGQTINFKRYGIDQGIKHPSIYSISQDKNGFIWLATGAGASRFDGTRFELMADKAQMSASYANISYKDRNGHVWFGFGDGSIACYKNGVVFKIQRSVDNTSVINAFAENSKGQIVAASQSSGIFLIEKGNVVHISKGIESKLVYAIAHLYEDKYLFGMSDGVWFTEIDLKNTSVSLVSKIKDIPASKINCIIPDSDALRFWVGTDDSGFYLLSKDKNGTGYNITNMGHSIGLAEANVQSVLEDDNKNLWVCTFGAGVYKVPFNSTLKKYENPVIYNEENGLGDNYIKSAIQDDEGNIWFGTYSNGLSGIIDEAFVFYNLKNEGYSNDILSVASANEWFWLGGRKVIYKLDPLTGNVKQTFTEKNGLPADDITALKLADNNTLWIGTSKNGVYKMNVLSGAVSRFFNSSNSLENSINAFALNNQNLWVATNGGVFSFNLKTGQKQLYNTNTGLPHNKINHIFTDNDGDVWIATKSDGIQSLISRKQFKLDEMGVFVFTSIAQDKAGNLWASTYGEGIFVFTSDSPIHITEKNGLVSDYGYGLQSDSEGNIWVGHRLAISKINAQTFKAVSYGTEIGIAGDCNANALDMAPDGTLRFGTTGGLIQYNYSATRKSLMPPAVNFIAVKVADNDVEHFGDITLPYGKYKLRFDFVGLNYRAPSAVRYQYKLEGWETEWSELSDNTTANYPRIEDGNYTFLVRAFNAEGISNEHPLSLSLKIAPPLWKRWWFIALMVILLAVLMYLIIKYRERKQLQFQAYLQKMLDERTREVVEQKEEIENKNRDITDSINYAQRIQTSILPSMKRIQDTFDGCFIFYQPRDIVSGDFYWFDRTSDSKFVIVCGDSTGHGVPGALMSMIGTTLIKDICNRPDVVSPSNILEKLDEEMQLTLNQNVEIEHSSDGMDMIACEIDTQTNRLKVASAMRPIILYINGEQIYVAGSKSSIGGNELEMECKDFENVEYQLNKGDLIYMFSDGYPDQFGGPMGKKFKMVRLRNLLRDIHELPMEEQYQHVKNTFNLWRDQYDQVDDVLFMGIKI